LLAEIPFRAGVVVGGAAATGLGAAVGGTGGAIAAGVAYNSIAATPDIILGNKSPSASAVGVATSAGFDVAGKVFDAPLGTAYAVARQGTDWLHQWRVLQATRIPR
jgi:hypothetical protein